MLRFLARYFRIMETAPVFKPAQGLISLTATEHQLFEILKQVVKDRGTSTVLRVAGGWARDKLLGLTCGDIDIALDNIMGEEFAKLVRETVPDTSGFGTIRANPEASKHLETACMKVMGIEIDFVNLRAEDYTDNSRIPAIVRYIQRIGTPEEDAYRRDLTINSIFYNLQQDMLEDYTGRGFQDIQNRIARTPLPPLQTFLDDPLRVLRTIRFTARFSLTMYESILQAASDSSVRDMLKNKVSRERVSKEYCLMVKGSKPKEAIHLLHSFHLLSIVFRLPEHFPDLLNSGYHLAMKLPLRESHENFYLFTAGILAYYRDDSIFKIPRKNKFIPIVEILCLESLKFSNAETRAICAILKDIDTAKKLLTDEWDQLSAGLMCKRVKEHWPLVIDLAMHDLLQTGNIPDPETVISNLHSSIIAANLDGIWNEKPILSVTYT